MTDPTIFHMPRNRDAWPTIRGYVYQAELSIQRWLDLQPDEYLELECGEDIDKVQSAIPTTGKEQDRILEQVKHLEAASVTLHSPQVLAALANFYVHSRSNPSLSLRLRFTTNAKPGREQGSPFSRGVYGLDIWENIRQGTQLDLPFNVAVAYIRTLLQTGSKPDGGFPEEIWQQFQGFLAEASVEELHHFIRACEWSTNTAEAHILQPLIQQRLKNEYRVVDDRQSEELYARLFLYVFRLLSQRGRKVLTVADREQQLNMLTLSTSDHAMLELLKDMHCKLQERMSKLEERVDTQSLQQIQQEKHIAKIDQQIALLVRENGMGIDLTSFQNIPILASPPADDIMLPTTLDFVGRQKELDWLINTLKAKRISMVRGMGGIGKSTLAAVAIKHLRKNGDYPDGMIIIDCKDLANANEVMECILAKLNVHNYPIQMHEGLSNTRLLKKIIEGKNILILLDNIEPDLQLESLVPPLYELGASLLITARHPISSNILPREICYHLKALPLHEAMEVLSRAFGGKSVTELSSIEYDEVKKIVRCLDCHTFAVKLAGSHANDTGRELHALAEELKNLQYVVVLPDGENAKAVAKIFTRSLEKLPLDARRLFIALSGFSSLDMGRKSIIDLARSLTIREPEMVIDLLIRRSLLDPYNALSKNLMGDLERIRLHPLLSTIISLEFSKWTKEESDLIFSAICQYYLKYDAGKNLKVIDLDLENITHSLEWAYQNKKYRNVISLAISIHDNICTFRRDAYILKCIPLAIDSSKKIVVQEKDAQIVAIIEGMASLWMIYYASALKENQRLEEALTYAKDALSLAQKLQNPMGLGAAYEELGDIEKTLGHLDEALSHFNNALSYRQSADQQSAVIENILNLSAVLHQQGRNEEAIRSLHRALEICDKVESNERSIVLKVEGYLSLYEFVQIPEDKEEYAKRAIIQALNLSDEFAIQVYLKIAFNHLLSNNIIKAEECLTDSLRLSTKTTRNFVMIKIYIGLVIASYFQDKLKECKQYYEEILEIRKGITEEFPPEISFALNGLEQLIKT